ncbi:MAG: hypothetical protein JO199_04875 [Candidatus Eremiobacteraeota bacterium]|nr:hypothetical protein [Candidatus Eremiobacteraeota bacterium]
MLSKGLRSMVFALAGALFACSAPAPAVNPNALSAVRYAPKAFTSAKLFVLNYGTVTVYDSPYSQPPVTIGPQQGIVRDVNGIALGPSGSVWVQNCCAGNPVSSVREFLPPYTKAAVRVTKGINTPIWSAVTSKGWLVVANQSPSGNNGNLLVYKPPYTGQPANITFHQFSPIRVIVGPKDELFVLYSDNTNSHVNGSVQIFKPPYAGPPAQSITEGLSSSMETMTLSPNGILAVGQGLAPQIVLFAPPYRHPIAKISNGVTGAPHAIALAPNGYLAEADDSNEFAVWKPPYRGAGVQNQHAIEPFSLTFDANSNLFVAETYGTSVDVFAAPYTSFPAQQITNGVDTPTRLLLGR